MERLPSKDCRNRQQKARLSGMLFGMVGLASVLLIGSADGAAALPSGDNSKVGGRGNLPSSSAAGAGSTQRRTIEHQGFGVTSPKEKVATRNLYHHPTVMTPPDDENLDVGGAHLIRNRFDEYAHDAQIKQQQHDIIQRRQRRLRSSKSSSDSVTIGIARAHSSSKSSKSSKGSSHNSSGSGSHGSKGSKSSKGKGGSHSRSTQKSNVFDNESSEEEDDDDDDSLPTGPVSQPTRQPTPPPVVKGSPPTDPPSPPSPIIRDPPTLPPNNNNGAPTVVPTPSPNSVVVPPVEPRCQFQDDGLFGTQLGLAEVTTFSYQATVIQSVTSGELNLNLLSKVETTMGERILERIIDQCAIPTSEQRHAPLYTSITTVGQHKVLNPFGSSSKEETGNGRRRLQRSKDRMLQQPGMIEGFSIRPRDIVVEGVDCVNVEPVFPCFVIQGRVTSYTEGTIDDSTKEKVRAAIRTSIEAGGLDTVDNRILEITYRDLDTYPIPDVDGNGGAPTPTDGNDVDPPTPQPVADIPVVRADGGDDGGGVTLENWMIGVIAGGGAFLCIIAFLCLRKPKNRTPLYDDDVGEDDDKSKDSSSSSSSSSSSDDDDDNGNADNNVASRNAAFAAPTPLYGTNDDNDDYGQLTEPLNSAPPTAAQAEQQNPYLYNGGATATAGSALETVQESSYNDEPSVSASNNFEQESQSEETSYHDEEDYYDDDDEEFEDDYGAAAAQSSTVQESTAGAQSHMSLELDQSTIEQPSAITSDMDDFASEPTKFEEEFDGNENAFAADNNDNAFGTDDNDNAFGSTTSPQTGGSRTSEEFSSEYSSYEDEEVEEEYEIEYVEDEDVDDLDGVEEEEESWEDEEEDDAGQDILPWA